MAKNLTFPQEKYIISLENKKQGGIKMQGKVQPKTLPGFMELLPNEQILFNQMRETIEDTYKEFGTGIVGSRNPHVSEILAQIGWKYDVNEHGEKGWVYPKGDGTYGWTKGISAQKKFYNAMKNMEDSFKTIAIEEFRRISRK